MDDAHGIKEMREHIALLACFAMLLLAFCLPLSGAYADEGFEAIDLAESDLAALVPADSSQSGAQGASWLANVESFVDGVETVLFPTVRSQVEAAWLAIAAQADPIDLNAAWEAIDGGLKSAFTITEGGTYYLSADCNAESNLTIDAEGQDVVIQLKGHTLTLNGSGAVTRKTMLSIVAARSVTLDGATESGMSTIVSAGELDVRGIASTAEGCALRANDLTVKLASKSNSQRNLSTHAVCAESGTVMLERCTVQMNMGNQALRSAGLLNDKEPEVPSAVFATEDVKSVELVDCKVTGEGTQGFALDDFTDGETIGNAYAVYSLADSTTVRGGTYRAASMKGNATCLYGSPLRVKPGIENPVVTLQAGAGQLATGILSTSAGSVHLEAPMAFEPCEEYAGLAQVEAALRANVANGFSFGACAPEDAGATYAVLVLTGKRLQGANADGTVIGSFKAALDAAQRESLAGSLVNALGNGACGIVSDGSRARFQMTEAEAVARIGDSAYYSTMDAALADLSDGDVLTLLKDAGAVSVEDVGDAVLDLGGHTIESLDFSASQTGNGLVVKNGTIDGTQAVNNARAAVYHRSPSPLTLEGVTVVAEGSNSGVYGIYATRSSGTLSLFGSSSVNVTASRYTVSGSATAYGINMASGGPALVLEDSAITVATPSANVAVYGLYSAVSATVRNCEVNVTGTTAVTCAAYAGGSFDAADSTFDVRTTSVATMAGAVWMRTSNPKAVDVGIESCTLCVRCDMGDTSGSTYACLLGSTSNTGTVAPTGRLYLAGSNSFECAGSAHVGLNVGSVTLADDFSLKSSSESPVIISQSQMADDRGFSIEGAPSAAVAQRLARSFAAQEGSCYEGWRLTADSDESGASYLVWRPDQDTDGTGIVQVVHDGQSANYTSLARALAAAETGDTVKLLGDLSENGAQAISQADLTLDLGGHELTLRAGGKAKVGNTTAGSALAFTGTGTLTIRNGSLEMQVGDATETTAGGVYQGVSVSGGGTLDIARNARIDVGYTGSTTRSAAQRDVALRGIAVSNGTLNHEGALNVTSARSDGAIGAMTVYGVFGSPASDAQASIDIARSAQVNVNGLTAAKTTKNAFYAEQSAGQGGPAGLREITIDPDLDPDFYRDVVAQFRESASFDDPDDFSATNAFGASIYYVQAMALEPEDESAWYNGLRIWAYSDEVQKADVGKAASMVPAHIFVAEAFDELTNVYGIATGADAAGTATVTVNGSVEATNAYGNAVAIQADGAEGSSVSCACDGARLAAQANGDLHGVAGELIDLRDYISFTSSQEKRVAYAGIVNAKAVDFRNATARGAVVGDNASFSFDGALSFDVRGGDAAEIEASAFTVGSALSVAQGDGAITVANAAGENEAGAVFASPADGAHVDASLFEDAYAACDSASHDGGSAAWQKREGHMVLFKVGGQVVTRYSNPGEIDLAEPSALVGRPDDQRQSYTLVGWSTNPDANATSGYEAPDAVIAPTGDCVYYAVFSTSVATMPVSFTNVHDASGAVQDAVSVRAVYGQAVGEALADAGQSLPQPQDYVDERSGTTFRFAGWYPYSAVEPVGPLLYDDARVLDMPATLALAATASTGALELRATYVAVKPNQHIVTFDVDGYKSVCVVDDGDHPVYTVANSGNTNYTVPSKQTTEPGKTYTFSSWYVDRNGNGSLDGDEPAYVAALPRTTADVTYTADWTWEWSDVTFTFYVKYRDEKTGAFVPDGVRVISTTYETSTQDVADSIAKVGSSFGYGGKVYTLDGWASRKTDVDPVYDADNPLPSVNGDDRALTTSYSKTYYGIYSSVDHRVNVTFYDGNTELGQATVVAASTSVNAAFAATGATRPVDQPSGSAFLGWATSPDATSAVEGISTQVDDLSDPTGTELSLYAVYGKAPTYTVLLRSADGGKTLYQISAKRGTTVNEALAKANVSVSVPKKVGAYFAGFHTAANAYYSLDAPVTGTANVYATYRDVTVETQDENDIGATVTVDSGTVTKKALSSELTAMRFSIESRGKAADSPIRATTAKNGYTILKSYDIRLFAETAGSDPMMVSGEFGTAKVKVYVGSKYRNAKVRAFWLAAKGNGETVMNSAVKDVDDKGYITVNIGNYTVGDADEGGNLAIAYVEGGSSGGLSGGGNNDDGGGLSGGNGGNGGNGSGGSIGASGLGGGLSGSSLGGGLSGGGLASAAGGSTGLSSSKSNGESGDQGLSTSTDEEKGKTKDKDALSSAAAATAEGDAEGAGEQSDAEGTEEGEAAFFDGWDSNAVVLLLLAAAALAALLRGLWVLLVVRQRREEEEAEMPAMENQYAEGLRF